MKSGDGFGIGETASTLLAHVPTPRIVRSFSLIETAIERMGCGAEKQRGYSRKVGPLLYDLLFAPPIRAISWS